MRVPISLIEQLAAEAPAPKAKAKSPTAGQNGRHARNGTPHRNGSGGDRRVERCRAYMAKVPPAVAGEHGHDRTFQAARIIWNDFGIGLDDAWAILVEFNDRCEPPWDEDELRRKLDEAIKAGPGSEGRGYRLHDQGGTVGDGGAAAGQTDGGPPQRGRDPNRGQFQHTDLGNAERFSQYYAADVKYAADRNVWLVFDGQRWAEDRSQVRVESLAKEMLHLWATGAAAVVGEAAKELANAEGKEEKEAAKTVQKDAQAELDFALLSQDRRAIGRMLHLARSEPGIVVHSYGDCFDRDNWLLNTVAGTVDLRTGELHPHNRDHYITKITPVGYDPAARSPRFLRFLDAVFGGDSDLVGYVMRVLGYALTGDTSNHVVHVFYGGGSNGKSVLVEVLKHVWGEYGGKIESTVLVNDGRDRHPTERASLAGLRFAFASETEEGRKLDAARIKELSGGDTITARKMRQDFFEFPPTHKLFLCTNHKPRVPGTDHGIWRRLRLILFGVMFWTEADKKKNPNATFDPKLEADPTLTATLLAEASGILAMLVQEAVKYHADRSLTPPDAVVKATGEYQKGEDTIGQFFDERVIPDPGAEISAANLYDAYLQWADQAKFKPAGSRTFGEYAKRQLGWHKPNSTYYRAKLSDKRSDTEPSNQAASKSAGSAGPRDSRDNGSPAPARSETYTEKPADPRNPRNDWDPFELDLELLRTPSEDLVEEDFGS